MVVLRLNTNIQIHILFHSNFVLYCRIENTEIYLLAVFSTLLHCLGVSKLQYVVFSGFCIIQDSTVRAFHLLLRLKIDACEQLNEFRSMCANNLK